MTNSELESILLNKGKNSRLESILLENYLLSKRKNSKLESILLENYILNEGKIVDYFKNILKWPINKLVAYSLKSVEKLKELDISMEKQVNKLVPEYNTKEFKRKLNSVVIDKKRELSEAVINGKVENIIKICKKIFADVSKFIKNEYTEFKKILSIKNILTTENLGEKIFISFGLISFIIILNTTVFNVLTLFFIGTGLNATQGLKLAMYLSAVFIAPIFEEIGKNISIKQGFTGGYFILFNIAEFLTYFIRMLLMGISVFSIIIMRLLPIIMHYTTTRIQYKFFNENKERVGLTLGTLIHMMYNGIAVVADIIMR